MNKLFSKLTERQRTVINVSLIIILMTTFVFLGVRLVSGHYWTKSYYLGDKGTLGDAVNGLSAPFISFFSAILIYITFREQNKANKLLQSQWQIDTFLKIFNEMTEKIKHFHVRAMDGTYNDEGYPQMADFNGLDIVNYISMVHSDTKKAPPELTDFIYIIDELTFLCELINESPENRREFMKQKVLRFYFSGFNAAISTLNKNLPRNDKQYRSYWGAIDRLKKQTEKLITVSDLLSAPVQGQEHEDLNKELDF